MTGELERRFSLDGQTAMVVGASRGIGLAIARGLAEAHARTVLVGRDTVALDRAVEDLRDAGYDASPLAMDVTDAVAIEAARAAVEACSILFVVAGMNIRKPFAEFTDADYDLVTSTNMRPFVRLASIAGPAMVARGGGVIVAVGSVTSTIGLPNTGLYGATKSALAGLTRALAAEWGPSGVRVNCIAPGFVLTDMTREVWDEPALREWLDGAQALPRLGTPDDIVGTAIFLAGPASNYLTGQVIAVDGGFTTTSHWPLAT